MVLCFCHSPEAGQPPANIPQHAVMNLPTVPPPAKLPPPVAQPVPMDPSTPPPRAVRTSRVSPRRPSVQHCPIPRIPDFEGLVESETDSDDELLQLAAMRASAAAAGGPSPGAAASTSRGSSSAGGGAGAGATDSSTGLSPLSSLMSRIATIGRSSPSKSNGLRPRPEDLQAASSQAGNPASSADDLAAAAHRAEVRRLTHKMIQEELQKERPLHPSRSYKRSTMTTIREDPFDGPSSGGEGHPTRRMPGVSMAGPADASGPRDCVEYAVVRQNEDLAIPDALDPKGKGKSPFRAPGVPSTALAPGPTRSFALQGGSKVGLPQGLGVRGRARGSHNRGLREWMRPAPVADEHEDPSSSTPMPPLLDDNGGPSRLGALGLQQEVELSRNHQHNKHGSAPSAGPSSKGGQDRVTLPRTPTHLRTISDSLSSLDEDGSIHEAREAVVFSSARSSIAAVPVHPARSLARAVVEEVEAGVQPHLAESAHVGSALMGQGTKHVRGSSAVSDSSQISSLNLPPPLINSSPKSDGGRLDTAKAQAGSHHEAQPAESSTAQEFKKTTGNGSQGRKLFGRLQFFSLSRLNFAPGFKKATFSKSPKSPTGQQERQTRPSLANLLASHAKDELDSQEDNSHPDGPALVHFGAEDKPHGQLKPSHSESSKPVASETAGLVTRAADQNRRLVTRTCPPMPQSSPFKAQQKQRGSYFHLWSDTTSSDNQTHDQAAINPDTGRPTAPTETHHFPESWWVVSPANAPAGDSKVSTGPKGRANGHGIDSPSPLNEGSSSETAKEVSCTDSGTRETIPPKTIATGLERTIMAGIKRVILRKQNSELDKNSRSTVTQGSADTGHASESGPAKGQDDQTGIPKDQPQDVLPDPGRASPLPVESSAPTTPPASLHQSQDDMQDIDSIFGALINVESNPELGGSAAASGAGHLCQMENQLDDSMDQTGEQSSQTSAPSTPVSLAYATMEAYITSASLNTLATTPAKPAHSSSPSSSYRDAKPHPGNDFVCQIHSGAATGAKHKSVNDSSPKSDHQPLGQKLRVTASPSKSLTWNGTSKTKQVLLGTTVQFSAELETMFQPKKENAKTFGDHAQRPIANHD